MLLYTSIMPQVKKTFEIYYSDFIFDAQEQDSIYQDPFQESAVGTSGDSVGYILDTLIEAG